MYEIFEKLMNDMGVTSYRVGKETGINPSTFTNWKNGIYAPKIDKLQKIADYFGVSIEYLMTGEDLLEGLEDDLECKLIRASSGNDNDKKELLELVLQLDNEDTKKIRDLALLHIEAKKKG